jgi:two-component system sensor histidine kinase/response regulator
MMERTLSADLHSLEQLVQNWPDAVLVYDGERRRYVVVNAAAERLLGYTREEILALQPGDLSHPDDAVEIPAVLAEVETNGAVRRAWRGRRKDGGIVHFEMTLTRPMIDGRYLSQGIFRVVDETLVTAEVGAGLPLAQLKFLERTGLTVVALDPNGIVTYWNAAATVQYGYEATEAIGRPVLELAVTEESRSEVESLMSHHQTSDEWVSKMTIRPRRGTPFEAMVTGSVIRAEDGELGGFLFVSASLEPTARPSTRRMRRAKVQCAACGREVTGTMRRKYCSEKCRQWAYYHRHLEAQRARSRNRHVRRRDAPDDDTTTTPDVAPIGSSH